jgi:hypothetical protein
VGRTTLAVYRANIKIPALILSPLFGNLRRGKKGWKTEPKALKKQLKKTG